MSIAIEKYLLKQHNTNITDLKLKHGRLLDSGSSSGGRTLNRGGVAGLHNLNSSIGCVSEEGFFEPRSISFVND